MSARHKLAHQDGWLCVSYTDTQWREPVEVTHFWPVARMTREEIEYRGLRLGEEAHDHGAGLYSQSRGVGLGRIDLRLKDGGQTQPIRTEESPIPPPKRAREVKYERGRWWKHLAKKGWVEA